MELLEHVYRPGEILFKEGDPSDSLYMLLDGAVEVLQGGRQIAVIEEPGSFIGEMSSLLREPRNSTVRALQPSLLQEVTEIEAFFAVEPKLTFKMACILAERLKQMNFRFRQIKDQLDGWNLAEGAAIDETQITLIQGLIASLEGDAARG